MPLEQLFCAALEEGLHFSPLPLMEDTSEGQLPPQLLVSERLRLPRYVAAVRTEERSCYSVNDPSLEVCLQDCNTSIVIAPVTYVGQSEGDQYADEAFYGSRFIKHDPYQHEKELRALAYRINVGSGVDIPIDVDMLIERVLLSPELADWAVPVIAEVIRRFGLGGDNIPPLLVRCRRPEIAPRGRRKTIGSGRNRRCSRSLFAWGANVVSRAKATVSLKAPEGIRLRGRWLPEESAS
jgi:hypothetical protein